MNTMDPKLCYSFNPPHLRPYYIDNCSERTKGDSIARAQESRFPCRSEKQRGPVRVGAGGSVGVLCEGICWLSLARQSPAAMG